MQCKICILRKHPAIAFRGRAPFLRAKPSCLFFLQFHIGSLYLRRAASTKHLRCLWTCFLVLSHCGGPLSTGIDCFSLCQNLLLPSDYSKFLFFFFAVVIREEEESRQGERRACKGGGWEWIRGERREKREKKKKRTERMSGGWT